MRFIENLNPLTEHLLTRLHQQSQYHRVRDRAQCILLSSKGYTIAQLREIFSVNRVTISIWFSAWEQRRFAGLYDALGKGRKPKFTDDEKQTIRQWAIDSPKNLKKVCATVKAQWGKSVSPKTIGRIIKSLCLTWRRIRRCPAGQPSEAEYESKKVELERLETQHRAGIIDLRYLDESGFCLTPYVPYAWQEKDQTLAIATSKSQRLNVLGFLNTDNQLWAYTFTASITSDVVIACISEFCSQLSQPTVLVIDNATIHTSEAFLQQIPTWQEKGLSLFYLPKYSPQLNLIEILWRKIKYEWIEFWAYLSFDHLVKFVEHILVNFGTEYQINFV